MWTVRFRKSTAHRMITMPKKRKQFKWKMRNPTSWLKTSDQFVWFLQSLDQTSPDQRYSKSSVRPFKSQVPFISFITEEKKVFLFQIAENGRVHPCIVTFTEEILWRAFTIQSTYLLVIIFCCQYCVWYASRPGITNSKILPTVWK